LKLLAFNASPRKTRGATEVLMNRFVAGAKAAGAQVERHYVSDLMIKGCTGCFSCWWKTPGKCVHNDDMDWVLPRMAEADIIYTGTPIYHGNIVHSLQRMREKTLPIVMPEMVMEGGVTRHPSRVKGGQQLVLAAVCGFPDLASFRYIKDLFPDAAHIFLPAAQTLFQDEGRSFLAGFLDDVWDAGYQMSMGNRLTDEHVRRLVVEYPDDLKRSIVEAHNERASPA